LGAHDAVVVVVVDVASRNNRMTAYASADNHGGTTGDVGRTTTATAAAMIPPSSSSSSSSSGTHFPNWRVVDPRRGEDDRDGGRAIRSPFCHSPSPSSTDGGRDGDDDDDYYDGRAAASQSHDAAPWSESAYRSSLDLHDRIIAGMGMTDPPTTTTTDGEEEGDGIASLARRALHDIGSAYRLHGPYCTIGSYNGGKDACVALHLMRAAHADHCRTEMLRRRRGRAADPGGGGGGDGDDGEFVVPRPRVIYFQLADEFPEVLSLLRDTSRSRWG
jgi:hypothetical protein